MSLPLFGQLDFGFHAPTPAAESKRHIQLGPRVVSYTLTRSRRRTLGMTIDQRGLRVGAPRHVTQAQVDGFLTDNAAWVLRKLEEWQRAAEAGAFLLHDGATLPLLGEPWRVHLGSGNNRAEWRHAEKHLHLGLRSGGDAMALLRRALQRRALPLFRERAAGFAPLLSRAMPPIALSSAQTRWGSCSSRSGVRINWRLVHLPLPQIDYVIAHELAHLAHMNHSARFWSEVGRLYPAYPEAREALKILAPTIPRI